MLAEAILCLAMTVYFEARGEPVEGQAAVAAVVMQRAQSRHYPNYICEVVTEPRQFEWYERWEAGALEAPDVESDSWKLAYQLASNYAQGRKLDNPATNAVVGATHFHAASMRPWWISNPCMVPMGRIGNHLFYQENRWLCITAEVQHD